MAPLYTFFNENIFIIRNINNVNALIYVYLLTMVSAAIALLLRKVRAKRKDKKELPPEARTVFTAALIVFFLFTAIQMVDQIKRFSFEIKAFSGKTVAQKNSLIFDVPYRFAMFCREYLPGVYRGEFITDLDLDRDPGMTLHRRVSYHLYPINVRVDTSGPIDCYVVFYKKNPQHAIPEDTKRIHTFDQVNILAIKDKQK